MVFDLSHLLFLALKLLVQPIESLVNRSITSLLSKLGFYYHSWCFIDLRVHKTILLVGSLLSLFFQLLVNLSHEVVLVLKELVKIPLLIPLLNWVDHWLECAAFDVFILHLSLHLLNLCLLSHVEFVNSCSELLLIKCFLDNKAYYTYNTLETHDLFLWNKKSVALLHVDLLDKL